MKDRGWVEISVWNTLGQRVASLVDGEREAGYHEAVFSNQSSVLSIPSGIYYYRIVIRSLREHFVATKAMVLMK